MTKYRKKLIEVALPLEAINKESAREKSIRHGHPSTLHLWWARRPLAACRAVLFSSLVNDPEDDPMYGVDEDVAYTERAKLFDLITELVKWENSNNPRVINAARLEIARSIAANKVADKELQDDTPLVVNAPELPEEQAKYLPAPPPEYTPREVRFKMPSLTAEQVNHFLAHYAPPVLDPFAGGGSIPLEAQRLGLRAYASDLNPVPVLINKALIEIPPKFGGQPPVNPDAREGKLKSAEWHGAQGLAEDVRYYGKWMRDEAEKRIGHLYPKVKVSEEMAADRPDLGSHVGKELTVIAWIWARTVKSPNPAVAGVAVPLLKSFTLSKKKGNEAYIQPIVDVEQRTYRFVVNHGKTPTDFNGTVDRRGARCLLSNAVIPFDHVREAGKRKDLGQKLLAIVADGSPGRVYLSPSEPHESVALQVAKFAGPDTQLPEKALGFRVQNYGMTMHADLFSKRQLAALSTFSELVNEVQHQIAKDANGDMNYAEAVATYLAFAVGRSADKWAALTVWNSVGEKVEHVFGRNALSMTWDFPEGNPFSGSTGNWTSAVEWCARAVENAMRQCVVGDVRQCPAQTVSSIPSAVISTDPPYYDNVPYADLSDFFYVWLRLCLQSAYPELLSTMLVPKAEELIAEPCRHGGRENARDFFEQGMISTFQNSRNITESSVPATIYYAFKQAESSEGDTSSTGWETFLEGLIQSDWSITGTWPMRTERAGRLRGQGSNALASSIILVCRPRSDAASIVTRRDFANALRKELPEAVKHLQSGNVAPVDLAQASIGPGMAVFSRYKQVVNADGSPMSVREALQMINQVLDEALNEQEADFDAETRFAVRWFEQYGMTDGPFGDAETLSKAMAVSVQGIMEAGIVHSKSGKVRLLKRDELNANWNPATDRRCTIWECTQHLIRRLEADGESAAAQLLADIQQTKGSEAGEVARELAYRLYSTCERKNRAADALSYNGLVVSWPEIGKLAHAMRDRPHTQQQEMF
ncbi:MAG: DUF1156 domain-containing protein [Pirellulaceae bacterium]